MHYYKSRWKDGFSLCLEREWIFHVCHKDINPIQFVFISNRRKSHNYVINSTIDGTCIKPHVKFEITKKLYKINFMHPNQFQQDTSTLYKSCKRMSCCHWKDKYKTHVSICCFKFILLFIIKNHLDQQNICFLINEIYQNDSPQWNKKIKIVQKIEK